MTNRIETDKYGSSTYDANGNEIHRKDSDGFEEWYDADGNEITKPE